MKTVNQEFLHDPDNNLVGDCWRACIASVLELSIDDVPHFALLNIRDGKKTELKFLAKHGYAIYGTYGEGEMGNHPEMMEDENEYYFAIGESPRDKNVSHQVVCYNGMIVHDPHPDKSGLNSIMHFEILFKINQEK